MKIQDVLDDADTPAITPRYGSQVTRAGERFLDRLDRLHEAASAEEQYDHLVPRIETQQQRVKEFLKVIPTGGN